MNGGGSTPVRDPLERLLAPVRGPSLVHEGAAPTGGAVVVVAAGGGEPVWLHADAGWRALACPAAPRGGPGQGELLERFRTPAGTVLDAMRTGERQVTVPFSPGAAYANFVAERWRDVSDTKALSPAQLNLFYRVKKLIPRAAQLALRRVLIRRQGQPEFPRWPLDDNLHALLLFYARCLLVAHDGEELPFRWFWPEGHRACAILTHDVESAEGLRLTLELADLEEARGFRSSFNVVADWYPIDHGILRELRARGFEIGVHGVYHDRSMFSDRATFDAQQERVREAVQEFEADGFKSPGTHRVNEWLADLPVSYDCTVPHSDPYEPQPGGCSSLWPWFIGDVVELPYTLPQDHTLFTLLQHRTPELWLRQMREVQQRHGLVQCVTHPDPGYLGDADKRALYVAFLDELGAQEGVWNALPRDVAAWWRRRDAGDEGQGNQGRVTADGDVVRLIPPPAGAARAADDP